MKNLRKNINKILITITMLIMTLPMNVHATAVHTRDDFMEKFNAFVGEYEPVINIALGALLLLSMVTFFYHIVSLNKNADNPQKRSESIHNLLTSGICLAIQGSITLFTMLYFYIFN